MSGGKALKLFGLSPDEQVKEVIKKYLLEPGYVAPSEQYRAFWEAVATSQDAATVLIIELITKLSDIEGKAKSLAKKGLDVEEKMQSLVHTVLFVDLFFPSFHKKMARALALWSKLKLKSGPPDESLVYNFVKHAPEEKPLVALWVHCASPALGRVWPRMPSAETADRFARQLVVSGTFPYLYLYCQGSATGALFDSYVITMFKMLKAAAAKLRTDFEMGRATALGALIMLHEAVAAHPVADPQLLKTAIIIARRLEAWPRPMGEMVSDVVDRLIEEMTTPGTNLRRRLLGENPLLTQFGRALAASSADDAYAWAHTQSSVLIFHENFNDAMNRYDTLVGSVAENPYSTARAGSEIPGAVRQQMDATNAEVRDAVLRMTLELDADVDGLSDVLSGLADATLNALWDEVRDVCSRVHAACCPQRSEDIGAYLRDTPNPPAGGLAAGAQPAAAATAAAATDAAGAAVDAVTVNNIDVYRVHLQRLAELRSTLAATPGCEEISLTHSRWYEREITGPANLVLNHVAQAPDLRLFFMSHAAPVCMPSSTSLTAATNATEADRMSALLGSMVAAPRAAGGGGGGGLRSRRTMGRGRSNSSLVDPGSVGSPVVASPEPMDRERSSALTSPLASPTPSVGAPATEASSMTLGESTRADYTEVEVDLMVEEEEGASAFSHLFYPADSVSYFAPPSMIVPIRKLIENAYRGRKGPHGSSVRPTVKLCAGGSDRTLHLITCSIVALWRTIPDIMKSVDVQVFVVPTESTAVGGYLALRDPWYRRQVFAPFAVPSSVFPPLAVSEETKQATEDPLPLSPASFLRPLLQHYFRGARVRSMVNVFDCECWTANMHKAPTMVIPFMSRVELGLNANVALFQHNNNARTMPWNDVVSERTFLKLNGFTTPSVNVTFLREEQGGSSVSYAASVYHSIAAAAVPIPDDGNSALADPLNPWLQLYTIKPRNNMMNVLSRKDKARDLEALQATLLQDRRAASASIIEITVQVPSDSFHVQIDGNMFGPFCKIRLSASHARDTELKIPLMSFFPLEV